MTTRRLALALILCSSLMGRQQGALVRSEVAQAPGPWNPDLGNGLYRNPVIFADYSDPDVVRVGDEFYLVSSSFNCVPALPILRSTDLVNWRIVGHAVPRLPARFDVPQHGKGLWAPSLRYHAGRFWIYVGDPDAGIYMTSARDPRGPWAPLVLVREARGWIDPCPLWDTDGRAYLVHAWAKSRAGVNSILTVHRLSPDGRRVLDEGVTVFDGHANHPTIEGPKFYKRGRYYYIFAPAGGVANGWQTVLRATSPLGPYADRIVLDRGTTAENGPHQGGWVDTANHESWFVHFEERGAYGRLVHLQPMAWKDDWPVIGRDEDGDGRGEPVATWQKPRVRAASPEVPQTSDEFDATQLGLQWQWHANPSNAWYSLSARPGTLRLTPVPLPGGAVNLWEAPNLLLQKFPAPAFSATAKIDLGGERAGAFDLTGLLVMGLDYAYVAVRREGDATRVEQVVCLNADQKSEERVLAAVPVGRTAAGPASPSVWLRVSVGADATCRFAYSTDGAVFQPIGQPFAARPGLWIGAKVGLFARRTSTIGPAQRVGVDYFRVAPDSDIRTP